MERAGLAAPPSDEQCGDRTRYENMREIVYAVRSARLYAPWLRNVYVVVADGQDVPPALAGSVEVVPHSAIMPREILPTFCSNSIEAFLHRIPGLSEIFLYANDDFFFWKPTPRTFFVEEGAVRLRGRFVSRLAALLGDRWRGHMRIAMRSARLVRSRRLGRPYLPEHSIHVMRRSTCERVWDVLGAELSAAVASRFRDEDRSLYWQLLVYSLEDAPRHVRSWSSNVVCFDTVERSAFARLVVQARLRLLARFAPHTVCFNTIPPSWHPVMRRYLTDHLAGIPALPAVAQEVVE